MFILVSKSNDHMLCSTLNRFQGAICGSLIAETLWEIHTDKEQKFTVFLAENYLDRLEKNILFGSFSVGNMAGIAQAKSLIESQELNLNYFLEVQNSTSEMALANLPLILFCHENPQLLKYKLEQSIAKKSKATETLTDLLIWGKAIALALTEKLKPQELIAQLLTNNYNTELEQQLEQIQTFLEQDCALNIVVNQLSRRKQPQQTAIALALYCFAFTPNDFFLSITRARLCGYQPQITTALTGALAGVYNGYHNIPLNMRLALSQHSQLNVTTKIASQLYSAWCGVNQPLSSGLIKADQAIASPQIMQKRSQLHIISQQDYW